MKKLNDILTEYKERPYKLGLDVLNYFTGYRLLPSDRTFRSRRKQLLDSAVSFGTTLTEVLFYFQSDAPTIREIILWGEATRLFLRANAYLTFTVLKTLKHLVGKILPEPIIKDEPYLTIEDLEARALMRPIGLVPFPIELRVEPTLYNNGFMRLSGREIYHK